MSVPVVPPPPPPPPVSDSTESYSIRWGDFDENLRLSLYDLRRSEHFLDVTLCLNEERSLRAHKVILSSCSPYFRRVLVQAGDIPNPLVLMPPETRFGDLAAILEFVYMGQVSVNQSEVDSFMALAKYLKIKGLTPEEELGEQQTIQEKEMTKAHMKPMPAKQPNNRFPKPYYEPPRSNYFPTEEVPKHHPGSGGSKISGTTLMGLICPRCRAMCADVVALKDHMAHSCPAALASPEGPHNGGVEYGNNGAGNSDAAAAASGGGGNSVACNMCDKFFKSTKTMMAHQKRVHREENEESTPPLKKRKRPSKMNKFPLNSGSEDLPPVEEGYGNLVSSSHEEQQQSMQVSTPRKPQVQQQQYWKPAPAPSSTKTMDLQKIGRKLGGQISITSSETEHPPLPPSNIAPHSPMPSSAVRSPLSKLTITKIKDNLPPGLSVKEEGGGDFSVKEEPSEEYEEEKEDYHEDEDDSQQEEEYEEGLMEEGELHA